MELPNTKVASSIITLIIIKFFTTGGIFWKGDCPLKLIIAEFIVIKQIFKDRKICYSFSYEAYRLHTN